MADKTLKINIVADASGFVSLTKGFEEVAKTTEKVGRVANTLAGQFEAANTRLAEFTSLKSKEYSDLTLKLLNYNDLVDKGLRSETIARGNAQASITKYNNEVAKTTAEYEKLALAMRIASNLGTGSVTRDNRGYIANAGAATAKKTQAEEYALVTKKLAITQELENRQLARHIAYENELKQQQLNNINRSVLQQAEIRSREDNLRKKALADLRKDIEDRAALDRKAARDRLVAGLSQGAKFNAQTLVAGLSSAGAIASTQAINTNTQAVKANNVAIQDTERHTRNLFIRVGEAIGSYRIWNTAINLVTNSLQAIPNIGIELESTRASLIATTGSAANMASTMLALHDEAARTGIAISTLRESFRGFQASTSLAGASAESTWKMFTNLNTVITGLHLPMDKANGIFLAMAQIFNKGKVQSEELVKQLGNLLPGAFASMAASMGISGQELSKRMKAGVVLAKDVMENFTDFYAKRFAPAFNLAAQGLNANIGRMKTAFTELGETLYSSTSSGMNAVVKSITNMANYVNEAIVKGNTLSEVMSTLGNVAMAALVGTLGQITLGFAAANASMFTMVGVTNLASAAMARLEIATLFLSRPAALIAGMYLIVTQLSKFRDNADSALEAVKKTLEESKKLAELPQNPNSLEYKVANDPEVKRVTQEYEHLSEVIDATQNKLNDKNLSFLNAMQKLGIKQAEQKAALSELGKLLDNLKEKAKITIQVDSADALQDISAITRQLEIDYRQASGDTVTAAKMMYEDQRKKGVAELKAILDEGKALSIPTTMSNIELKREQASKSTVAEDKERAQAYVDNYNKATKALEQYEFALSKAGQTSKKATTEAKDYLRETKAILSGRLEAIDEQAKVEDNILKNRETELKVTRDQNLITEVEYLKSLNSAQEASAVKQDDFTKQRIALVEQELVALDKATKGISNITTTKKLDEVDEAELIILEAYNKALEERTVKLKDNSLAFGELYASGTYQYEFEKKSIEEMIAHKKIREEATNAIANQTSMTIKEADAIVRRVELEKQLSTLKQQLGTDTQEESNRKKLSEVEIAKLFTTEMEKQIDKYNELTRSARDLYIARLQLKGLPPTEIKELVTQYDENASIELRNKGIDDARIAVEKYNESLQTAKDSFTSLSDVSSAVFDSTSNGISKMTGAFSNMLKALEENRSSIKDLHDAKIANEKLERATANKTQDEIKKNNGQYLEDLQTIHKFKATVGQKEKLLELDAIKTSLGGLRQTSDALGTMFKENSNARKAFSIISLTASVAERIADIQALTLKASIAVLEQGKGDPYTAFARMAAMAAIVASVIAAAGAGTFRFGGGSKGTPPPLSSDTGTVLGDSTAKSESLSNIATLLENIHAKEYRELRGINNGIIEMNKGVTNTITRLFQAGGLPNVNLPATKDSIGGLGGTIQLGAMLGSAGLAKFDPISNAILGFLFGGKQTKTVLAQGIATGFNDIGDLISGSPFYASYFADIETKTKGGIFSSDKTSFERIFQPLDVGTRDALTSVFRNMGNTMFTLAESLGEGLGERVKKYVIQPLFIDIKGLSGEDAAKKVSGVISAMLDTMTTAVFGDIIGKYQQFGEGMLETAVRIVSEVAVVKDALGISGITLTNNAIEISDSLIQAAGSIKIFQDQFENFYDKFYSNAEKQTRLYGRLSETFSDVGSVLPATRKGYRDLLEGLDLNNEADRTRYSLLLALSDAADTYFSTLEANMDTYRQAFRTEEENQARLYRQLSKQLASVDSVLPSTREGFRKLVEGLDLTNVADRKRYYLLLELSGAADTYYRALEDVAEAQRKAAEEAKAAKLAAKDQARQDIEAAKQEKLARKTSKTDAALDAYEKQLKSQLDATLKSIEAQKKVAQDIVSKWNELISQLKNAKDSTIVDTLETTKLKRLVADAVIANAAATARAGGAVNISGLDTALTEIAKPSENLYSSFEDYALAQARTGNNIEDLSKHANAQKTTAEKTLESLDNSAKAAQNYYTESLSAAKAQVSAIRDVGQVILSLADAIAKEAAYRNKLGTAPVDNNLAILNAYQRATGLEISAGRMVHFQEVIKSKGLDLAGIVDKIANSRDARIAKLFLEQTGKEVNANRMRDYLKILKEGGTMEDVLEAIKLTGAYRKTHFTGLDRVPFDGYQATLHKNEAVVDASSIQAIQRYFKVTPVANNAISEELLTELKLLRKTVEEQGKKLESIDKSSKSSADTLDKSSAGGPLLVQVV